MFLFVKCSEKFLFFQHLVFFVGRMIDWGVPDVPESLQLKIKRENYLAKQALTDNIKADSVAVSIYV